MAVVTQDKIDEVVRKLCYDVYERSFRGKRRGRFALTRSQMKAALGVQNLHAITVQRVQETALDVGVVVIDLDDLFPCIEIDVVRRYRRPPKSLFQEIFAITDDEIQNEFLEDDAENADEDE